MIRMMALPLSRVCVGWGMLCSAGFAAAQETASISVTATGVVTAKPDTVEILGTVSGQSELGGDALAKFHNVKQQALDALKRLSISGLQIEPRGFSITEGADGDSRSRVLRRLQGDQVEEGPKVAVREALLIRLAGADKLDPEELLSTIVKILDAGREAGVVWGRTLSEMERMSSRSTPQALASFKLSSADKLRQQAYELAMDRARSDAPPAGGAGQREARVGSLGSGEQDIRLYAKLAAHGS